LEDKLVKELEVVPCILVNRILWAPNNNVLKDVDIPPKINANQIIHMRKELKVTKKEREPWIPIMLVLDMDIPWGLFDGDSQ